MRSRASAHRGGAPIGVVMLFVALGLTAVARADGGAVRLQQVAGPFAVTVFAPEPLRAGPADLSVLVRSAANGEVLLDAVVDLVLTAPESAIALRARATQEAATNKLLQAVVVDLPEAGTWSLEVEVRRGAESAQVEGTLQVEGPAPRLRSLWPYLALPPVAVFLFAAANWLSRRRRPA